jgi:hypothetical protein
MELIKKIASIINSNPKSEQEILLPIQCINELPIIAKIVIVPNTEKYLFFVDIDVNGVDIEEDDLPLQLLSSFFYDIEIINPVINNDEFLDAFKGIINNLAFCRINGKLNIEEDICLREIVTNSNICFESIENCVVCLEPTKTVTSCDHTLCLICWSKIKGEKRCPICREILFKGS